MSILDMNGPQKHVHVDLRGWLLATFNFDDSRKCVPCGWDTAILEAKASGETIQRRRKTYNNDDEVPMYFAQDEQEGRCRSTRGYNRENASRQSWVRAPSVCKVTVYWP
jgi:hypothetical protein